MTELTITLPQIITAEDYHEFDDIAHYLKSFGANVRFEDLGLHDRDYVAIFYTKKDDDYKKLIKEYVDELE